MLEDSCLENRSAILDALPKVISFSKPQNEKAIRNLLTLCLEKGPDFIRAQTVASILSLAEIDKASATALLKTSASLSDWRVRYAICSSLDKIGASFGAGVFGSFLTKNISDYLLDQNADTRVAALDCIPCLCKYVEADQISTHILPCLTHTANDTEVAVKIALASKMPLLVPKVGKRKFNDSFLPLILSLIRDESLDVRSTLIEHFGPIFEVVGPSVLLDAIDPALADLSKCVLWRHKKACLKFICTVAKAGGREAVRDSLLKVMLDMVRDSFDSVRLAVADTVEALVQSGHEDWVVEKVMPDIEA